MDRLSQKGAASTTEGSGAPEPPSANTTGELPSPSGVAVIARPWKGSPEARSSLGVADVYVGLAVLAVLIARFVPFRYIDGIAPCTFRSITALPCPSCGFTRAFIRAANLDLAGAFFVSPLGTLLFAAVSVLAILGSLRILLRRPWPRIEPGKAAWRLMGIALALALLTNWAYLLYRHLVLGDWA